MVCGRELLGDNSGSPPEKNRKAQNDMRILLRLGARKHESEDTAPQSFCQNNLQSEAGLTGVTVSDTLKLNQDEARKHSILPNL